MVPPTTELHTLSLHDALPIYGADRGRPAGEHPHPGALPAAGKRPAGAEVLHHAEALGQQSERLDFDRRGDRKSTRLNSSHLVISYAVFCLKKKKRYEQN